MLTQEDTTTSFDNCRQYYNVANQGSFFPDAINKLPDYKWQIFMTLTVLAN